MIKKFTLLKFNILSALNVISGFLLTIFIMKYFGANTNVDKYFTSLLIVININVLAGFFYFSFLQHYLKIKHSNYEESNELYISVLILSFIISSFVLFFYQLILNFSHLENIFFNDFIKYFIYLIILIPIFEINNFLINSNSYYSISYFLLIINNLLNLLGIIFFNNLGIEIIIYTTLIGYTIAIFIQFLFIIYKIKISLSLKFHFQTIIKVIKSSFILKISSIINGSSDILIAYFLTNINDGLYSIYSYARKFALGVFNISNGPIIKKFNTDIANLIHKNEINLIFKELKKTALYIIPIFILGETITFFLLKFLLNLTSINFDNSQIIILQNLFIILAIYYLLLSFEYLFNTIINQFHEFKVNLKINIIFAIFFAILSLIMFNYTNNFYLVIISLPLALSISIYLETKFIIKKALN